jgi:hypothetical protein
MRPHFDYGKLTHSIRWRNKLGSTTFCSHGSLGRTLKRAVKQQGGCSRIEVLFLAGSPSELRVNKQSPHPCSLWWNIERAEDPVKNNCHSRSIEVPRNDAACGGIQDQS